MNNEALEMKVTEHDVTLKEHTTKICKLENETVKQDVQIQNLCGSIKDLAESNKGLVNTIKWGLGLGATILVPLFMYIFNHLG